MSDQTTEARILLTAEDRASAVVQNFKNKLDATIKTVERLVSLKMPAGMTGGKQAGGSSEALNSFNGAAAAAKKLSDIEISASRQRQANAKAEASNRRLFDKADVAAIRQKLAFSTRIARQRVAELRQADREQARADARAERDAAALGRRRVADETRLRQTRERTRREVMSEGRQTFSRGRDAARDLVRPPATLAAAGAAVSGAGARRILQAEGNVDSSEINTRIYGGLSKDAARKLRDQWAAPLAESLGAQTDKLLDAYVEATKVGIPAAGAQAFAELATKTSEAWSVPFDTVTDTLGTVNSILTSKGAAYDGNKLKSVANTLQYLAAKQSTTPEKLISFLSRGAGGADMLGMSMESALAFGSASTSLGNQAGQSGSLLDYIAGRVIEMPKLARQHGQEGKEAKQLLSALGYGSAAAMDAKRRQSPDDFVPDLLERLNKIKDPKKQEQATRFFFGREWLGEGGRMVKGVATYRESVKLSKEAKGLDAIGAVWDLHRMKLSFVFKQFKVGWLNILGEFGKELSPMARQAGDYFLAWTSKLRAGGLSARFRASLNGFLEGLGFNDLPDMLRKVLGDPGAGGAGAISAWKSTFREFGAGIADVVGSIKGVIGAFTGGDPEVIARWTGRILALSVALVALSPVVGIITGLASGILAIASAASGLTAAGIVSAGVWTAAGGLIAVAFLAAIADKLGILKAPDVSKGWGRGILEFLDPGIASRVYGDRQPEAAQPETGQGSTWREPPARVRRQSSSSDWRGLIKPAAFDPGEDIARNTAKMVRAFDASGAKLQLASFGNVAAGFGNGNGGFSANFGGGGGAGGGPGHAGMKVAGWYGSGSNRFGGGGGAGGGSASSNPANSTASAAMLDAIAGTESGKGGYDTVLGNGKYGTPNKPVSTMSLDEAFAFGRTVKARHGSSSALGRYQIVGNTMRSAQAAMNIPGTATFDAAMQDRMARWIARNQGLGAWEGLKTNSRAMAAAQAAMAQGGAKDVPTGAGVGGVAGPSGDVGGRIAELQKTGAIANQQCVSLVKAFSGSAGSVLSWRKGEGAEAGTLKPGTPIATFLNRDGSQSERYAGGGTGTPGAGLDHAAIFKSYVKDAAGKIVGMQVAEQYQGSGGVRDRTYRFGEGRGEKNGSNYSAVLGQDGNPLGGARNPMSKVADAAQKAVTVAEGAQKVVDGFTTTGWRKRNAFGGGPDALKEDPTPGGTAPEWIPNRGDRKTVPLPPRRPGAKGIADSMPTPPRRPSAAELADQAETGPRPVRVIGQDGKSADVGSQTTVHAPISINGANLSPQELSGHLQRHVSEARNFRSHDLEPELS